MTSRELSGTSAVVTGASRGFGRGIAIALAQAGVQVVGVARDHARLAELHEQLGEAFTPVVADATDPVTAGQLLDQYRPRTLVLNAGASPLARPVHLQTWQTFSRNWEVDVQHVFGWVRESLLLPLEPGSVVIAMSSGAALRGSPLSGGYAGAKATIRFIASYAAAESQRGKLGAPAVAAYAARQGVDIDTYLKDQGPALTPGQAGQAIAGLAAGPGYDQDAYLLTAAGLSPVQH